MEQIQVLSAVCKKLNYDIEVLANQIAARETTIAQFDGTQRAQDDQLRQFNVDLQMKLSRTDTAVQRLQSDIEQLSYALRDAINGQQELNRTNAQRHQELKLEVNIFLLILKIVDIFCFHRYLDWHNVLIEYLMNNKSFYVHSKVIQLVLFRQLILVHDRLLMNFVRKYFRLKVKM